MTNYSYCCAAFIQSCNLICCFIIADSTPRRSHSFQIEDYKYDITLESSERAGHQLITNVFDIFLREVLGYESVKVLTYADHFDTRAALERLKEQIDRDTGGVT